MIGTQKAPWHLWAVALVSLLWNAMGGVDYTLTHLHNPAWLAQLKPEEIDWIDAIPIWATACWAIGVWGAIAGSLLLLVRSRWAVTAFVLSLLGLIGSHIYQYTSNAPASMNTASGTIFAAVLAIIALALLWYAMRLRKQGVLR
jgi:uncharacterized membrane protein